MRVTFFILTVFALAGCGKADNEPGPGGVSMGEARALDEAAEMIERQRLPEDLIRQPAAPQKPTAPQKPAAEPVRSDSPQNPVPSPG